MSRWSAPWCTLLALLGGRVEVGLQKRGAIVLDGDQIVVFLIEHRERFSRELSTDTVPPAGESSTFSILFATGVFFVLSVERIF